MSATPILIGAGRIGTALHAQSGWPLLGRAGDDAVLREPAGAPIVVCVRNDDLDAVLARIPAARRADLVLIQNGMLDDFLRERGLADATRGLLFFSVATRGAAIEVGGTSPFSGPHAERLAQELTRLGIPAEAIPRERFTGVMLEKLAWNCLLGLLCQVHDCDVGTTITEHAAELVGLCGELAAVAQAALGVAVDPGVLLERVLAYSRSIPRVRAAVREWRWRNGWFVKKSEELGVRMPLHQALVDTLSPRPA